MSLLLELFSKAEKLLTKIISSLSFLRKNTTNYDPHYSTGMNNFSQIP
jgi:hypothetical protein